MGEATILVIVDCDGTLLRSDYALSDDSASFLSSLEKRGILLVLASGRPPRAILPYYEKLSLKGPIVCYNGGLVYSPSDPFFPKKCWTFPKEKVLSIFKEASPFLLGFQAEGRKTIFRLNKDEGLHPYFWEEEMKIEEGDPESILTEDPYSVVFKCERKDDEALKGIVEKHPPIRWRHWTDSPYSELYYPHANKGTALSFLLSSCGLEKENVYAFGDSMNDYEMLSLSGHPFVMKNARAKKLLEEFPLTEKGNDEDGVLFELKKIFL